VILVEGLTDLLAASSWVHRTTRGFGVIGVTSGSSSALANIAWPSNLPVYVATDPDPTGDAYARGARIAIPSHIKVSRIRVQSGGR
jgi:hypothetical protein